LHAARSVAELRLPQFGNRFGRSVKEYGPNRKRESGLPLDQSSR
jgi:hypothetical protein